VHHGLEQLPDDREWEVALELGAPSREGLHVGPSGGLAGGLQEPRLSNPGRTLDDDEASDTATGILEGRV
jgi:hypothetical protein